MIIHPQHCRSVLKFALALAGIWLVGCTALDTSNVGSEKISTLKPQVGRYYLLPKALITIEGAADTNGNLLIDASVSLVADSKFRYFLRWRPNVFSEDIFNNIDVDSDGMLTSINYSAEDKTPQILSDLVTTTVNIAKIAKDLGAGLDTGSVKYPPFTYTFDPFDAAETNKVKSQLSTRQNIELQISPRPSGARSQIGMYINGRVTDHTRAEDPPGGGVFYHPPTTIEMLLVDHNVEKAAEKAKEVAAEEKIELAAAQEALAQEARAEAAAQATATPPPGSPPTPTPPPANPQKSPPPPAPDKTQPMPKPATLCHVVVTVPDVDQVACLPLGRSFLTKRESNLGFAHGMPTTFVFKQPSGVQAFTGTLSSISSIVASAVPTLINVKSTPSAPAAATQTPVAAVQNKTPGSRSGGKTTSAPTGPAALGAEETPPPTNQDYQDELNRLSQNHQQDTDTINKVRLLLILQLKAEKKTSEEINAILIENKMWPLTASELKSLSSH